MGNLRFVEGGPASSEILSRLYRHLRENRKKHSFFLD